MSNISIIPINNLPEFESKHDLADEIVKSFSSNNFVLEDKDIIVITQKIVSKVEDRLIKYDHESIDELIQQESIEILRKRVGNALNRPMIKGNIETNIQMLLNKRIKNYQKSHIKINTENNSIEDLCKKIIKGIT